MKKIALSLITFCLFSICNFCNADTIYCGESVVCSVANDVKSCVMVGGANSNDFTPVNRFSHGPVVGAYPPLFAYVAKATHTATCQYQNSEGIAVEFWAKNQFWRYSTGSGKWQHDGDGQRCYLFSGVYNCGINRVSR